MIKARIAAAALVVSASGAWLVASHEGEVRRVYLDPVGIPTVCVGHTATVTRADLGKPFSAALCKDLLKQDLRVAEAAVKKHVKRPVTQGQYDALVSFTFNVGAGNLANSTLLRLHNSGYCLAAAQQFDRWVYARGKKLPGLVKRRADERKLYEAGCDIKEIAQAVPQVQPPVLQRQLT